MPESWTLVDPVARVAARAKRERILRAGPVRAIGFLENHKPNAKELQRDAGARIAARIGVPQRFYGKPTASLAAPQDLIARIAAECDVAVVGSAD